MTSASQQSQQDVSKVEECALNVVNVIQRCIHAIRSTKEFDPAKTIAKRNKANDDSVLLQDVRLYSQLESDGIVEEVSKVQALVESTLSIPKDNRQGQDISTTTNSQTERFKVVNRILLPLITSLASCYAILDALPAAANPPAAATTASAKGRTKAKPPPPPRGMLSIQNYTDIAALLEFIVCTSILPNVQEHVITPVEERARHQLPKSLAGRISRSSLLWGCSIQNSTMVENSSTTSQDDVSVVLELQRTVQAVGRVILLDRFRPMLLPRHLADLYAAMFQAEALEFQCNEQRSATTPIVSVTASTEYHEIQRALLPENGQVTTPPSPVVDAYSQARAYQTLLLRGTKAPLWLRQRVSKLLAELACHDLTAIVQVFVYAVAAASSDGDMTAASMRLARALVAGPSANNYGLLCQQLLGLLDVAEKTRLDKITAMDPRHVAGILTVWAVLDQWPLRILLKHMLPLLSQGLFPQMENDSDSEASFLVHRTVKRIGALLSFIPSIGNTSKVCRLFLCPIRPPKDTSTHVSNNGIGSTVFGQLLRIASIQSVMASVIKDEALWCLRLLVHNIAQSTFQSTAGSTEEGVAVVEGTEVAAMALLFSVAATEWDTQGYHYQISSELPNGETPSINSLDRVGVEHNAEVFSDVRYITNGVECRAKLVIDDLFVPLSKHNADESSSQVDSGEHSKIEEMSNLPSRMFYLLLLVYFSSFSSTTRNTTGNQILPSRLPAVLRRDLSSLTHADMMLLPLLCEQCSPASLLLGDDMERGEGGGVLGMIKIILDCASSSFGGIGLLSLEQTDDELHEGRQRPGKHIEAGNHPFARCATVFEEILALQVGRAMQTDDVENADESDFDVASGNETLLSTSSLVLSMLIALLELGSERRSKGEEELLTSIMPSLRSLAEYTETDASHGSEASQSIARAELAEMASHAMALISCRSDASVPAEAESFAKDESSGEFVLMNAIEQAEKDLQSDQPPIRARAVVTLRHLARGYLEKETARNSEDNRPLIEEISEETSTHGDNDLDYAIMQLLRVSVMSLLDTESYVYLAGIQTIVAAADVCPREIVPSIGRAVSTGVMTFKNGSSAEDSEEVELRLPAGQRIKLAEALLFTIRRRGSAIDEFVPYLMDLMVFGYKETDASFAKGCDTDSVEGLETVVQKQTNVYFQHGIDRGESLSEALLEDTKEEQNLRISTGGPVFDIEEDDVVRSACISVISELVSVSHPSLVARYCPALIRLVTNALRLDVSRPVRRSAALLCRELYGSVRREYDEAVKLVQSNDNIPEGLSLALEMVSSGEDVLFATLQRCVVVDDVDRNDATAGQVIKDKIRVYDPPTVARCQEAIEDREYAEQEGIFEAAKLIAKATELDEKNPVARIVRARLKENFESGDDGVVRAMKGLKVDHDSLRLL